MKASTATSEAVELLTAALTQGHAITLSLATPPKVIRAPPMVVACCMAFNLTPSQSRVLVALLEHGYVSTPDLHTAMSSGGRVKSGIKTVNVVVSHMRQRLSEHNITITAVWKSGYRIAEDDRDKLRQLLADHGAGAAGHRENMTE